MDTLTYSESVNSFFPTPLERIAAFGGVIAIPVLLLNGWASGKLSQPRWITYLAKGELFRKATYINWLNLGVFLGVPCGLYTLISIGHESQTKVDRSQAERLRRWSAKAREHRLKKIAKNVYFGVIVIWGGGVVAVSFLAFFHRIVPLKLLTSVLFGLASGVVPPVVGGSVLGVVLTEKRIVAPSYY